MKKSIALLLVLFSCTFLYSQENNRWKLTYANNGKGESKGDIQNLIDAVRKGNRIRIYWYGARKNDKTKKVEHFAEAKFLTIMSDTLVFAQIDPIIGQTPKYDEQTISLKENIEWTLIAASNGKSESMTRNTTTGEILGHDPFPLSIHWYVEQ